MRDVEQSPGYDSWVALGDSFTEGLEDRRPDGSHRGWADMVAAVLASRTPGFRYANLAVRGRRMSHVVEHQLPRAEQMGAALVTVAAGGNDIIGLRCDVPALADELHAMLERLVATGATVLVFTGFDARGQLPLGRPIAARAAAYNARIRASAAELGVRVVDLWELPGLYLPGRWAPDRLHLSAAGHAVVAAAVLRELGEEPVPDVVDLEHVDVRPRWLTARRDDLHWAHTYFVPWLVRKLRGRSTGDVLGPKRPELAALPTPPPQLADAGS